MNLTQKAEAAMITRLKAHQGLKGVIFRQQASESIKRNGDIIVTCKQGEEESPPSGVYNLDLEITLRFMVRRPAGDSLSEFTAKNNAVEEVLTTEWRQFSKELSAMRKDWHCYEFHVTGCDPSPAENAHQAIWSCKLVAMGQSFSAAAKL